MNGEGEIAEQIAMEIRGSKYCDLVDVELAGCGRWSVVGGARSVDESKQSLVQTTPLVLKRNSKKQKRNQPPKMRLELGLGAG